MMKLKDVDFFTLARTVILIKAYSCQTKSWISPISQYCGSDRSCCGSAISFLSSSDIINEEFIVFAGDLTIEMK